MSFLTTRGKRFASTARCLPRSARKFQPASASEAHAVQRDPNEAAADCEQSLRLRCSVLCVWAYADRFADCRRNEA
jgi:hypothetical protein